MIDKTNHRTVLESIYNDALQAMSNNDMSTSLSEEVKENIHQIIDRAEANKGLYTVVMTLFSHKIIDPAQDIRKHQSQIEGGFGWRSVPGRLVWSLCGRYVKVRLRNLRVLIVTGA